MEHDPDAMAPPTLRAAPSPRAPGPTSTPGSHAPLRARARGFFRERKRLLLATLVVAGALAAARAGLNGADAGTPEASLALALQREGLRVDPATVVWLASDDSDYIHGASIFVDGGMTLYPGFETGG